MQGTAWKFQGGASQAGKKRVLEAAGAISMRRGVLQFRTLVLDEALEDAVRQSEAARARPDRETLFGCV